MPIDLTGRALESMPLFARLRAMGLRSSDLGGRLLRGAFWSVIGSIISRGLNLLASIVTARYLGLQQFGELGMVQNTVMVFGVFAGLGLGMTANRYVAEFRSRDPARAGRIIRMSSQIALLTGALLALLLLVAGPWLGEATLGNRLLGRPLQISSVWLLFGAINGAQTGVLSGLECFKKIAQVNFLAGLLSFPILIGTAAFGGLPGAIAGQSASAALNCVLNRLVISSEAPKRGIPLGRDAGPGLELRLLWHFSLPSLLASLVSAPANWLATAILFNRANGDAQMGIFNATSAWRTAILFLPNALAGVVLPILTDLFATGSMRQYRRVLWLNIWFNAGVALLVALPIALGSPWIMRSYGPAFVRGWPVLVVMSLTSLFNAANNVIGDAIASSGRMWWGVLFNGLWAVSLVASSWLFVRTHGALGLAYAMLLSFALHSVWQYAFVARRIVHLVSTESRSPSADATVV